MKTRMRTAGVRAIGTSFPSTVRSNDYYRVRFPDKIAAMVEKSLGKLWSKDAPKDAFGGCSPACYAHHTVSQRVADYQRVLAHLKTAPWWDGRLVLFGHKFQSVDGTSDQAAFGGALVSLVRMTPAWSSQWRASRSRT